MTHLIGICLLDMEPVREVALGGRHVEGQLSVRGLRVAVAVRRVVAVAKGALEEGREERLHTGHQGESWGKNAPQQLQEINQVSKKHSAPQ